MSAGQETNSVDEIIAAGEGPTIEFKKSEILSDPIHLAKEIVALANTQGGKILIGVSDDGKIEGMKEKKEHELYVMNIARDRCDPPLIPLFHTYMKANGCIYEIRVSRYRSLPHAVKTDRGRVYFIRVGTTVREATPIELATLFEASREEITKKPLLGLSLLDGTGKAVEKIAASPVYTIVKKAKVNYPSPFSQVYEALENSARALDSHNMFLTKEPSPDLVIIRITLFNSGQTPAKEIKIFMKFPEACELKNRNEVIGGLDLSTEGFGGLHKNSKDESEAIAWLDNLGNDLVMDNFKEIYVKFPAETKEHRIRARVIQNNYPPTNFEFVVKITPQFREITE